MQNPVPQMFTRTAAECRTREQCCQRQWNFGTTKMYRSSPKKVCGTFQTKCNRDSQKAE